MATSIQNLNPRHPALMATADVIDICKPLTESLEIDFFCFHRVFKDGSEIMLSNNPIWVNYYYASDHAVARVLRELGVKSYNHLIWPADDLSSLHIELAKIYGLKHGISLELPIKNNNQYCDHVGFALNRSSPKTLMHLVNCLSLLQRFALYFRNKAERIIQDCSGQKYLHIIGREIEGSENNEITKVNQFINETFVNTVNGVRISYREYECIRYLLLGCTMMEIALQLSISPRTVETHFDNIKIKLGCRKKSDLIAKILQSDIAEIIINEMGS